MTNKELIEILTKSLSMYGEIPCLIEVDSSYDDRKREVKDCLYDDKDITIYNY